MLLSIVMVLFISRELLHSVGKYSIVVTDYSEGILRCHFQRNLFHLNKKGFREMFRELDSILPELKNELYTSGKIHEFNKIEFKSYFFVNE